jgi:nitrous oxide reductase accessory protein NosL
MRIRLLLAAAATLALAACSDASSAPQLSPAKVSKDEITCRSGYHIATRDDGSQYCETDGFFYAAPAAAPASTDP